MSKRRAAKQSAAHRPTPKNKPEPMVNRRFGHSGDPVLIPRRVIDLAKREGLRVYEDGSYSDPKAAPVRPPDRPQARPQPFRAGAKLDASAVRDLRMDTRGERAGIRNAKVSRAQGPTNRPDVNKVAGTTRIRRDSKPGTPPTARPSGMPARATSLPHQQRPTTMDRPTRKMSTAPRAGAGPSGSPKGMQHGIDRPAPIPGIPPKGIKPPRRRAL